MRGKSFPGGVKMASLGVVLFLVLLVGSVLAGTFTVEPAPPTIEAITAPNVSFTMVNTDPSENITSINITFPGNVEFMAGSDFTNMTDSSISNTTYSFNWTNNTVVGILQNGSSAYLNLSFYNMTVPGNYTFNINSTFTDGSSSDYDRNVTVVDTTPPSDIVLLNPDNDTWIATSSFWINISFTELNPYNCIYENNTGDNTTNTSTGSPCSILVTDYNESSWTYGVWVNDTSGNIDWNGTYYLGYDVTEPNLNSLGLFYQGQNISGGNITSRENVTISLNITDATSGVNASAVWANVYNQSDGLVVSIDLSQANGDFFNGTWDTDKNNTGSGVYTIQVNGSDLSGNTPFQGLEATLELLGAADLAVTNVNWASGNANPGHPTSSDNLTLEITVENLGDGNFTGSFNVTSRIDGALRNTTSLAALNESETSTFNVTFTPGNFSTNKWYVFTIAADPENAVNESAEGNNTYVFGLTLGYNISLITLNGTAPPNVGMAFPDSNITINFSVTYGNGDGVTGLTLSSFDFWNEWSTGTFNMSDRVDNFNEIGSGDYDIKFNTMELYSDSGGNKSRARFGDNYFNITATSGSYSGKSLFLYNITAPDLNVHMDIDDFDLAGASYKDVDFNLTITNNGNAPAYDISINEDDDWEYVSVFSIDTSPATLTETVLNPGDSHTFEEIELTATGTQSGSDKNLFVFVHYNDSVDNEYKGFDYDKTEVSDSGSGDDDDENGGGAAGGGELELEVTITDWEDEIEGYPGGSNDTRVEVKNTGDVTVVAKVSFTCEVIESPTIGPVSKSLAVGDKQEFIIDFNIKDVAEIGEYDCTAKAFVSSAEENYDTETVVLKILATEEKAAEINESYQNLSAKFEGLFERFSLINPALVNDTNLTKVENLLNSANNTLQQILESIVDGDYLTANDLIESLNTSLDNTEGELSDLELEQTMGGGIALSGTWFWAIIIIVVVIAVAFIAYLLFPQKGYGPKKGIMDNLKDTFRRSSGPKEPIKPSPVVEKKPFRSSGYREGYKKPPATGYAYKQGVGGKVKGFFGKIKEKFKKKKPQKEVTQYFKSSSSNLINYE